MILPDLSKILTTPDSCSSLLQLPYLNQSKAPLSTLLDMVPTAKTANIVAPIVISLGVYDIVFPFSVKKELTRLMLFSQTISRVWRQNIL